MPGVVFCEITLRTASYPNTHCNRVKGPKRSDVFCYMSGNFFENGFFGLYNTFGNRLALRDMIDATTRLYHEKIEGVSENGWISFCSCAGKICGFDETTPADTRTIKKNAIRVATLWGPGACGSAVVFDKNCTVECLQEDQPAGNVGPVAMESQRMPYPRLASQRYSPG